MTMLSVISGLFLVACFLFVFCLVAFLVFMREVRLERFEPESLDEGPW